MSTITEVVSNDHRELVKGYEIILNCVDADTATRWHNQFVSNLTRHLHAKEQVLHPAYEKYLESRGRIVVDKDRAQHSDIKKQLKVFQSSNVEDVNFVPSLESLMGDLGQHFTQEQMADLPALEAAITSEISSKLAKSFETRKSFVPTRYHPAVPNVPPFDMIASFMTAPLDYVGDMMRKFPEEGTGRT